MDSGARGEVTHTVVLHDQDGSDLFLLAEREGAGTINLLSRAHLEDPSRAVGSAS